MSEIKVEIVKPEDAEALLAIYAPYVKGTVITFEYEVPSVEEFRGRIENTLKKYPYVCAKDGDEILGYAYAGTFKGRAAYNWAVETTVYVKQGAHKKGIGRLLYAELERLLAAQNIKNLYACIAYPSGEEDEYLTKNSPEFHEHLGYKMIGRFHQCGYKFGRWYDMIWMEKMIGDHTVDTAGFIPFSELLVNRLEQI